MKRNIGAWIVIAVAGLTLPVAGQVVRRSAPVPARVNSRPARAPYTAEYKVTRVQTLANGTTITREDNEVRVVDAQGRERWETTRWSKEQGSVTDVNVHDPVARTHTFWSTLAKRATVHPQPGSVQTHGCSERSAASETHSTGIHAVAGASPARPTVENLGTDTIQGIEARGTRHTTTIPTGEIGNEAPLVSTYETWTAIKPDLHQLLVRQINDDPRQGKTTWELTSFTQGDPDPALFQPPADYEIVSAEEVVTKNPSAAACPDEGSKN